MLGHKISKLRKENNISQEELAKKLGTTWQTVSLWEDGDAIPSLDQIVDIADIFDVSTDVLLKDSFKKENCQTEQKTHLKTSQKKVPLLSVVLLFLIAIVAFITINIAPQNELVLSPEEIFKTTAPSTVEIHALSIDSSVLGTGFFIDDEGTVITNYHVIDGCVDADIVLYDGTQHSVMSILGYDKNLDIAILSTTCMQSTPVVYRAEMVSTGEKVYTLGSSLGLTGTFAEGIISSANRKINGQNFIQTTAPISSGNSGGPLVDQNGKVIGITTSSFDEGQNLNLAVPIVLAINIKRDNYIGSLKRIFLRQIEAEKTYLWSLGLVELALDAYIENPSEETRAYLLAQLSTITP